MPHGDEDRNRRSRDEAWAKKSNESSFGYKLHSKTDVDNGLIQDLENMTASVHESRVDLGLSGEVVYQDKGYHHGV